MPVSAVLLHALIPDPAALAALEGGANVLVLEKAPEYLRGGNSYFTGGLFRFAYDSPQQVFDLVPDLTEGEVARIDLGEYPQASFEGDVMRMTGGLADPGLARALASGSYPTMAWMRDRGVRCIPPLSPHGAADLRPDDGAGAG